jgi:hypothetical protein
MKKNLQISAIAAVLIILLSGISSFVNAQGVNISYNFPAGKAVKYNLTSTMAQIMDIEGQTMQTDVSSAFGCTVKSAGNQNGNLILEVTVDTLGQVTSSPMGGAGGPVQGIKGKSCNIVIAPDGKVVDISGAEALLYNLEGSGESNLGQTLSDFFPRLPGKPVNAGDTWNYKDSTTTKSTSMTMTTVDNAENKVEGFEKVDDVECAKIVSTHTGTVYMALQAQGMDIYIKGPYTGTSVSFFALKEGYFVKSTAATLVKGNLDLPSMGMNMPVTIDTKAEWVGT